MSKFSDELKIKMTSYLGWGLINLLAKSCRYQVTGYDEALNLIQPGKGLIFALWHGRTLLPIYYCRKMGFWAITSLSRDGELQTRLVTRFGYRTVRGSTGRAAIKAALSASKKLMEGGVLAITPDGPKGPYHEVQDGIIFMARHADCPIIPVGVGISPRILLKAWDKFAIPKPFAKVAIAFGAPIHVAGDSEEDSLANRELIKNAINEMERQAKEMVEEED